MPIPQTLLALAASVLTLFVAPGARAADYLSMNLGQFNVLHSNDQAAQYGLEYRFSEYSHGIHPVLGAFGTNDGAAYGYAGINWNVAVLPDQLFIIPNFAVGAYREGGGRDLGGALEFRSGIELAYQLPNRHQLGVALTHISNAGIYSRNPGVESLSVTYSLPVQSLF